MRLSAAIMAHPRRRAWVEELTEHLDRDIPVAWDPYEPSRVPAQRWANGRRAWEMHDPAADFHMVIQDDALVCDDLMAGLEKALDQFGEPAGLMSAYTGTARPDQVAVGNAIARARANGESWLATWSLNWGVAIIAPVATIPDMLRWCERSTMRHANYDMRVGVYYRDILGWRCWYPTPSLVDHRDGDSLVGHGRGGHRVAHHFHTGSALNIDWSATPGRGPLNPYVDPALREVERSLR